jgi:hypothetical protein
MFYPTGKTTGGRIIICKCCNQSEMSQFEPSINGLREWLDENQYCMETWQVKEYLSESGMVDTEINETLGSYDEEVSFGFTNKKAEMEFEESDFYDLVDYDQAADRYHTDKNTFETLMEYLMDEGYSSEDVEVSVQEDSAAAAAPGAPAAGFATVATVTGMGNVSSPTMDGTNASFYDPANVGSGDRFDARALKASFKDTKKKSKKSPAIKNFDDFLSMMKKLQ